MSLCMFWDQKLLLVINQKLIWLLALPMLFSSHGWSQVFFHLESERPNLEKIDSMSEGIRQWRSDLNSNHGMTNRKVDIFEMDGNYLAFPDGMGSVLRYDSTRWTRIDDSKHHGYNYLSKKFKYNHKVYSFGGYGFWRSNGLITSFNDTDRHWEVFPAENEQNCSSIYSFMTGDILYVLSPQCVNDSHKSTGPADQVLAFNFSTHRWNKLGTHDIKMTHHITLETDHYFYIHNHPKILIHKQSLEYKRKSVSYLEPVNTSSDSSIFIMWKDSILFRSSGEKDLLLDLNQEYDRLENKENLIKSGPRVNPYLIALFCVLAGLSFVLIRKRNKNKINDDPLILELIKLDGHTINQDRLDEILKINEIISADTRKARRSKLVNQINRDYQKLKGKDLINRVKNDEDMRFFRYNISK